MAEIDTSSYPKATLPVSPLKQVGELASLQQQKLAIDQAKLDQANQGLGYMTRAMGSLGPDASIDDYIGAAANAVKMGLVPENMLNTFVERAKAAASPKAFYDQFMTAAADHQQQINYHIGQNKDINTGNQIVSGRQLPVAQGGGFIPGATPPVNTQLPPGTEYYVGGQKKIMGAAGPAPSASLPAASPAGVVPPPQSRSRGLPVEPLPTARVSGPIGETIRRTDMEAGAPAGARSLNAAPPPMFEEGKKMLAVDQDTATAKSTALKPLEEAYDLAKSVATGPGTENLNKARAYLINAGIISADEKNPTVVYQMLNKNLAQFIDKNGSRSDADLAVKESGNANAKSQVQPALLHMVQKIIARERIEIARPSAFGSDKFEKYGEHRSNFPTSQDERAYAIDKMPADEAKALYKDMRAKALNGNLEAIKFLKSLATAKKAGVINGINQ